MIVNRLMLVPGRSEKLSLVYSEQVVDGRPLRELLVGMGGDAARKRPLRRWPCVFDRQQYDDELRQFVDTHTTSNGRLRRVLEVGQRSAKHRWPWQR